MKQVLLTIGIGLGLILIVLSALLGELYFNTLLWFSIGSGSIFLSVLLYRYSEHREAEKSASAENERVAKLMREGAKVVVDLTKCEMKTSSHHVETPGLNYLNEMEAVDIILKEDNSPQTVNHTVLVYKLKTESGKVLKFYGATSKDKRTLEILCTMQKQTMLYFDRNDPEVYYFDLNFLD